MKSAVINQTSIDFENENNTAKLRANGSMIKFQGFLYAYEAEIDEDSKKEEDKKLPELNKGQLLKPTGEVEQKQSYIVLHQDIVKQQLSKQWKSWVLVDHQLILPY